MGYAQVRDVTVEEDGRLRLEGLPLRAGERVQVVVIRRQGAPTGAPRYPLHGQPVRFDLPFEPAENPDEWEANQ